MYTDLSEDETALVAALQQFCRGSLEPAVDGYLSRHEFPTDLVREFGSLGYLGTAYSPEFGGSGMGVRGAALGARHLARI